MPTLGSAPFRASSRRLGRRRHVTQDCSVRGICTPAFALDPALNVSQYAHTSWKIRDGFTKGAIKAITQTRDGYIWLGTDFGLVRFDGVRTVPWEPPRGQNLPSDDIWSLLTGRDGTLWIGTSKGLASWNGNTLNQHPQLSGVFVGRLLEDREGTIWAGGSDVPFGRLCAIQPDQVRCYGENGSFGLGVWGLYEDRKGNLWAGMSDGLWRWQPGPPRFFPMPGEGDNIQGFDEDADGTLLITTHSGLRRFVDGRMEPYALAGSGRSLGLRLIRDRDGGLWMSTLNRGMVHVGHGTAIAFGQADGLSGDAVNALFEDQEGNMWIATDDGLDRFRGYTVTTLARKQRLASGYVTSVVASDDGSMWIGTADGLRKWDRGEIRSEVISGLPRRTVISLFQDGGARMWLSTSGGAGYLQDDRFIAVKGSGESVRAIDEDTRGNVWMIDQNLGLLNVSPEKDSVRTPWSAFGHQDFATSLTADRLRGGLWVGFWDGGIAYLEDGQLREAYAARDGLGAGHVYSLYVARDGVLWAATEGGVSRLRNGRISTLKSTNGLPCDAVHWMIEDDVDSFWLGLACGLVRVERSELNAWSSSNSNRRIRTTLFDSADGVRTRALPGGSSPLVVKSADGKLWFVPGDGVSIVDPGHLPVNTRPPPVHVEQVIADHKAYTVSPTTDESLPLPPLTRDLQIDYTALSLVAPEKMQFRYKLEGHDGDWQAAGTRRQAFYTNLAPGTYRFRVMASNNSGVWNEEGATLDFAIAPAYYQTTWFLALAAGMGLALVWVAHRIRLRIVEQHQFEISALNERLMKAQEQERIRIAGELHDGVMQQMLAAAMMLGTAKRRIGGDADARATIEKVQDKLVQVGTDIRQLSHDLHPPVLQEAGLPKAVQTYCEQFSATSGIPVACEADEDVSTLSRGAALALFRIVQEALGNAAKHAHAKQITVRLTRADGMVPLVIADDGVGFDPTRLGTSGGLGLIMMRERASQLNGTFAFESAPGRGTTINVVVPFR